MNYANTDELEAVLKSLANLAGDPSARPFRVDLLRDHGRSATVVMLSQQRSLLREKLSDVLHRSFALGIRSFVLQASEAAILVSNGSKQYGYGPGNSQDMDAEQALSPT